MMYKYMELMDVLILPSRNEVGNAWFSKLKLSPSCRKRQLGISEVIEDGGMIVQEGMVLKIGVPKQLVDQLAFPPSRHELRKRALEYDCLKIVEKEIDVYQTFDIQGSH